MTDAFNVGNIASALGDRRGLENIHGFHHGNKSLRPIVT